MTGGDFGAVRVGTTGSTSLTVANVNAPGTTLSGSFGSSASPLVSGPSNPAAYSVADGESTSRTYTYSPTSRGTLAASVTVTSNDAFSGNAVAALSGKAVGPVASASGTATVNYGVVFMGDVKSLTVAGIANTTTDDNGGNSLLTDLTVVPALSGSSRFSTGGSQVIAKGASGQFDASFDPDAAGMFSATITLATDEDRPLGDTTGESFAYSLSGFATPIVMTQTAPGSGTPLDTLMMDGSQTEYLASYSDLFGPVEEGFVTITGFTTPPPTAPVYVLLDLEFAGSTSVADLLVYLNAYSAGMYTATDASDPVLAQLNSGGDFEVLLRFNALPLAGPHYFRFDLTDTAIEGVTLERIGVIPEPAGLISVAGLGLLALRRRRR